MKSRETTLDKSRDIPNGHQSCVRRGHCSLHMQDRNGRISVLERTC